MVVGRSNTGISCRAPSLAPSAVSFIPLLDGTSLGSGFKKPDDCIDDTAVSRGAENPSSPHDD